MKTKRTVWTMWVMVYVCILTTGSTFADDPNNFNKTTGGSLVTSGTTSATSSCGWEQILSRYGSDGGQLTIKVDNCQIFGYEVESFPQNGGAGGTAELEEGDVIIVWDEDAGHGEDWDRRNFTFTNNAYVADPNIADPNNGGYLWLTTTDSWTNWAVYRVTGSGTFTKGNEGTNEHEVLKLTHNIMEFWKDDGIEEPNCVSPDDTLTYQICWNNDSGQTIYDVNIIDWLPDGVDYNYVITLFPPVFDPNYNTDEHYYVWPIGDIEPNETGCVELTVTVNQDAVPGMELYNLVEMYSDDMLVATADEWTPVCCWGNEPNLIYVDQTATGANTGLSWADAYTDLADALERATQSICMDAFIIYVAQGIYDPNNTPDMTFALPDDCEMYGGFKSGGDTFSNRDPKKYETILTGLIDDNAFPDVETIVTMGDETLLDGFIVRGSTDYGIYGDGVNFAIENCIITENEDFGIRVKDGDVAVKWCFIRNNGLDGIRHSGAGFDLTVENSWVMRNQQHGIYCLNSTPTIKNSIISESDLAQEGREGISIINPKNSPVLYNNTISNNKAEGIFFVDDRTVSDPNDKDWPDIQNCIVYYNNAGGPQFSEMLNVNIDNVAQYCCIQDCNEVSNNHNDEPEFAYTVDPNGTPDPNNYHLAGNSFCKEKGNPSLSYTNQADMDNDSRLAGTYVDIGADEVDCNDVSHELDWNADGLVNLYEFSFFQKAWLSHDPNDPAWLADPNLVDPNLSEGWYEWKYKCNLDDTENTDTEYVIDLADLAVFWSDTPWLWQACWWDPDDQMYGMTMGGGESMSMMSVPMSMSMDSTAITPVSSGPDYANMPITELAPFVKGIYEVIDHLETMMLEDTEYAEDFSDAKDFLEDVLGEIKTARQ